MHTIHIPLSEIQNLALLSHFAETDPIPSWMNGVMICVGDGITGLATDRYTMATVKASDFDAYVESPLYFKMSLATAKALLAIKPKRGDDTRCEVEFDPDFILITVEMSGVTYRLEADSEVAKRFPTVAAYLDTELADSIMPFNMNPNHLAKLPKLSKEAWQFAQQKETISGKSMPVLATSANNRFNVLIQPTLTRS